MPGEITSFWLARGRGVVRGGIVAVPIPAGMAWDPGFNTILSSGTYLTDYVPTAFKPIVTGSTFYVDPVSGNNGNTGLSPVLAVATLREGWR